MRLEKKPSNLFFLETYLLENYSPEGLSRNIALIKLDKNFIEHFFFSIKIKIILEDLINYITISINCFK